MLISVDYHAIRLITIIVQGDIIRAETVIFRVWVTIISKVFMIFFSAQIDKLFF